MNMNEVGNRIKICRKQCNITQENLAEQIDVSAHYIYEIERGTKTMSLSILEKLSTTLNISTDYIIFGSNKENSGCQDRLSLLVENQPTYKREYIADILTSLLPYLK